MAEVPTGTTQARLADLPPLSSVVSKVVLGGGSFTHQSHPNPETLPVRSIIEHAFASGIRTFDTSPYYGPSEGLFGDALAQPSITTQYPRDTYILMTKVGRIAEAHFDYSSAWIRTSVNRSLERLGTPYLDVVFCHDIEFVTDEDGLNAVEVLLEFVKAGTIRYVGCSGYALDRLVKFANLVRERYGRPLDAVQAWGQLTLQNTLLESQGLPQLRAAGVDMVFCSSPLCIGLLRSDGVPIGTLGDWHPAPLGLRIAVQQASTWVEDRGENLASVAIRFCISRLARAAGAWNKTAMIVAANSVSELESNLKSIKTIMKQEPASPNGWTADTGDLTSTSSPKAEKDEFLFDGVRKILGGWVDFSFTSPESGWDVQQKEMREVSGISQDWNAEGDRARL